MTIPFSGIYIITCDDLVAACQNLIDVCLDGKVLDEWVIISATLSAIITNDLFSADRTGCDKGLYIELLHLI